MDGPGELNRKFLPSQLDDISSIDGGAEFANVNFANKNLNHNATQESAFILDLNQT